MAPDALCALVLAAGRGSRLRPVTDTLPKPLLPVGPGGETLLDRALRSVTRVLPAPAVAVNAHHLAEQVAGHVAGRWPGVHLSVEVPEALGTAGAVGGLGTWRAGRAVLVVNGDAWLATVTGDVPALAPLVDGWDGRRPRLLCVPAGDRRVDFEGGRRFAGVSLLPPAEADRLPARPLGLYEAVWREAGGRGELDLVDAAPGVVFVDCGTPADYRLASLVAARGIWT